MRRCYICNRQIYASSGFVLARDVLMSKSILRELCPRCGFLALFSSIKNFLPEGAKDRWKKKK